MNNERWMEHPVYEDYAISTEGRVFNCRTGRFYKPYSTSPYVPYKVNLRMQGSSKSHTKSVHRLMAEAFFADYEPHRKVSFIDGDPMNCTLNNLEFTDGYGTGAIAFGSNKVQRRVITDLNSGDIWYYIAECAADLKVHRSSVSDALNGRLPVLVGRRLRYHWVEEFVFENEEGRHGRRFVPRSDTSAEGVE